MIDMFGELKSESDKNNDFNIRARKVGESYTEYINYLSSLLKYIKEEPLKDYLLDIINSLKSQETLLSEKSNLVVHNINRALKEEPDAKPFEEVISEKLDFLQRMLRVKTPSKIEVDVPSLEEIRMANNQAASNTMGQKNSLQDINIGDIISVQPGTILYDNFSMKGTGVNLDVFMTKQPFLVDNVLFFERREIDGQLEWIEMEMKGNIQETINDYNIRVGYNPNQYCKICHISQCNDKGQIIPSGMNGYIHNCEYELLEAKEEELELVA